MDETTDWSWPLEGKGGYQVHPHTHTVPKYLTWIVTRLNWVEGETAVRRGDKVTFKLTSTFSLFRPWFAESLRRDETTHPRSHLSLNQRVQDWIVSFYGTSTIRFPPEVEMATWLVLSLSSRASFASSISSFSFVRFSVLTRVGDLSILSHVNTCVSRLR